MQCNEIVICRVVEARLGSAFSFAGMRAKLNELQASNPGIAERDVDFKAVVGKQARWRDEGVVGLRVHKPCASTNDSRNPSMCKKVLTLAQCESTTALLCN